MGRYSTAMLRRGGIVAAIALAVGLLGGSGPPACGDHFLVRGGTVVGHRFGGFSTGADYLHEQKGRQAVLLSFDWAVNIVPIFSWGSDIAAEVSELTALVVSRPVREGSLLLVGLGGVSAGKLGEGRITRPLLRLTLTSGLGKVVVGQIRASAAPSLGVLTDLSLGVGF